MPAIRSIRRISLAFFLATASIAAFAQAAVGVSTLAAARNGVAGGQATYVVRVTNRGSTPDSYNMSIAVASGEAWNVAIDAMVQNLPPFGIATIVATVTLSAGAVPGQASVAHVTADSQGSPGVSASLDLTTTTALAGTRYVAASTGSDASNACTNFASPCKTITRALSQAVGGAPGDRIEVAAGTYNTALGEAFPLVMVSGVQLVSAATQARTILDATGANAQVIASDGANASTVIRGFTITGGRATAAPGAITAGGAIMLAANDQSTIDRNIFANNMAVAYSGVSSIQSAGGVALAGALFAQGGTKITNNVFVGNVARGGDGFSSPDASTAGSGGLGGGGAIVALGTDTLALVAHNTFYGNSVIGGAGGSSNGGQGGAGGQSEGGAMLGIGASLANSIFVANSVVGGLGGAGATRGADGHTIGAAAIASPFTGTVFTNNLYSANTIQPAPPSPDLLGDNAIVADPSFYRAPFDLHVPLTSPAAGAGASAQRTSVDLDGAAHVDPPTVGAYEAAALLDPPRLLNISTRGRVGTGDDVLIAGFVIGGAAPKTVVITATGPSLAAFGIANPLANPTLTLVRSSDQSIIATNDDWGSAPNAPQVQLAGFAPTNALESAILTTLPPGAYTAIVSGVGNGTGIGVVAVYEIGNTDVPIVNISTRGQVLTGDNVMIGGFVVNGTGPQRVAVVATGPSLAAFGIANALANPTLTLVRSADQGIVASNVGWGTAANAAQLQQLGFAPSDAHESAILITLDPGAYTAIVSGTAGGTGIAVIAVYAL